MKDKPFQAFNHLRAKQVKAFLKLGKQGTIAAGKRILKQNVLCRQIIFLLKGEVQVSLETSNEEYLLSTLQAPTVLEEISFFSGEPSSAYVTTLTQVKVIVIDFDVLHQQAVDGDRPLGFDSIKYIALHTGESGVASSSGYKDTETRG